jgi:hypothetical protein
MSRVKGFISGDTEILSVESHNDMRFVEEIPKNALRGDVIAQGAYHGADGVAVCPLPARLIGKKVSFIIIPEED